MALTLWSCSQERSSVLKVYNWADYIDEELLDEFEQWYFEQTGQEVEIIYQTFDINETMLSKIELGHEDYDVVCPSDYIIERMLKNDLLLPIDKNFGETPNYLDSIAPYILEKFGQIEGFGKDARDYSVGYMWGTVGLIYNKKHIDDSQAQSWEVLRDPAYKGKVLMKDAFRDVYTVSFDTSDESIALVENYLISFKESIGGWEADFGKEQMTKELAWVNLSWSGDAQWAIEEAAEMGVDLGYSIPKEGSAVWFDGWVIPKYARNVKAASYFINFMCKPENALRNMDMTGYVSAIGGSTVLEAMVDEEEYEPVDAGYFFGEEASQVCLNPIMYPDGATIYSCAMLHDTDTESLLKMWSRVKGANASAFTYVIISIVLGGLVVAVIMKYARKSNRRRRHSRK